MASTTISTFNVFVEYGVVNGMYDLDLDTLSILVCVDRNCKNMIKPYVKVHENQLAIQSLCIPNIETKKLEYSLNQPHELQFMDIVKILIQVKKYYKQNDEKICTLVNPWTPKTFQNLFTGFGSSFPKQVNTVRLLLDLSFVLDGNSQGMKMICSYLVFFYISKLIRLPVEVRNNKDTCILAHKRYSRGCILKASQLQKTVNETVFGFPRCFVNKFQYLLGSVKNKLMTVLNEL